MAGDLEKPVAKLLSLIREIKAGTEYKRCTEGTGSHCQAMH